MRLTLIAMVMGVRVVAGQAVADPRANILPPEPTGIPTQVLSESRAPNGDTWFGTYGRGIFVQTGLPGTPRGPGTPGGVDGLFHLRQVAHTPGDSTSISFDFVNSIAFGNKGEVWYGTVGNGWGLSLDNGKSWKSWELSQLGPEWQYVAPNGIVVRGDTVVIGTADGLQVTTDDGHHWVAFGDAVGPPARGPADTAVEILPSEYVLGVTTEKAGWKVEHLHGTVTLNLAGCLRRARGEAAAPCVLESHEVWRPGIVGLAPVAGPVAKSAKEWSPWFARPIAAGDNDHIDQTYRWGSTMGGSFQAHQGVEFNNPDGTPVHAIGDGTVVYAGRAEGGALTVGIKHDTMLTVDGKRYFVFSVYYHNAELVARVGDRVKRGDVISRVGNTGRATNDHMHLEVAVAPTDSIRPIIDSLNRYPPYTTNPELWIAPLPGTGVIAGTVVDAVGQPIPQARVYGINKPEPRETPFAYAETYGPHNRPHPIYGEQFAISDVPAGTQHLFVVIDGKRIERTVHVAAGAMTWVDFRP